MNKRQYLAVYNELMQTALKGVELGFDYDDINEQLLNTLDLMRINPFHPAFDATCDKYSMGSGELMFTAEKYGYIALNDVMEAVRVMKN